MARKRIIYEADDGTQFATLEEAEGYESAQVLTEVVNAYLDNVYDGDDRAALMRKAQARKYILAWEGWRATKTATDALEKARGSR